MASKLLLACLMGLVATREVFNEQLRVWPLENNFTLHEFSYEFLIDKQENGYKRVDYFPL